MIKLVQDYIPFKKGEILTFGKDHDAKLVTNGIAVWTKIANLDIQRK
jgi:hypothetical protein